MNKLYISKVLACGIHRQDSFVELKPGLNLIQGRSNTGKTCIIKCIDYCFGGDDKPFDDSLGYTTIQLTLNTPKGSIQISRTFGKNKVDIITNVPGFDNEVYDLKRSIRKKNTHTPLLSDLLLTSIGIDDEQAIYKNKYFETQKMTWRTILPLLLFTVNDIVKENSVIEPTQATQKTAFLSSLLLLINGKNLSIVDPTVRKEIRVARKKAVEEYVNKKISSVAEKKKSLEEQLALFDNVDVDAKMQEIINDIKVTEEKIDIASDKNKKIINQILELQKKAAECNLLKERYATLHGQYISDIKRLSFIVNGEVEMENVTPNAICPFCEGTIPSKSKKSYIESAQAELHRITNQMNGLIETENELTAEEVEITAQLIELKSQRDDIDNIIQEELQPEAEALKKALNDYRSYIQIKHELSIITEFASSWETDLRALPNEDKSETEYHPKELFDKDFLVEIDTLIKNALVECKFPNLTTARFNLSTFDIEINGHKKQNFNGQGYTAFLNSIIAMSFREYLSKKAAYDPGFLIIDTPLLGLDQGVSDLSSESMRTALYTFFTNHQNCGQVILLDNMNNVPNIDFESTGTNVITFTKGFEPGRYGFLMDVTD